ncbi:MAG: LysR family transcriptional regulator [Xanthobacteraceae bacterium]|nr:LysR family transcriptional regulator [Xanthobacteraceae bacterium]
MSFNNVPSLDWLQDFLAVEQTGSFTKAANLRNSSQPALSRRIQMLERWAGGELFDRNAVPIGLTEAGRVAKMKFEAILALSDQARLEIRDAAILPPEGVFVGVAPGLEWIVNHVIAMMNDGNPGVSYRASTIEPANVAGAFKNGELHFYLSPAIAAEDETLAETEHRIAIGADRLVPVSVKNRQGKALHRLTDRGSDDRMPYYGFAQATYFGREMAAFIKTRSELGKLNKLICTHNPGVIGESIVNENGMGWLPESFARRNMLGKRMVRAGGREYELPVRYMLARTPGRLPDAAEKSWSSLVARMPATR